MRLWRSYSFINCALLIAVVTLSACYRLIPKAYYKTYSKVISDPEKSRTISRSYISESYYKAYPHGLNDTSHIITCFYGNNLYATFNLPRRLKDGKWIKTIEDYNSALKKGLLDPTEDFSWDYYKLEGTHLTTYYLYINSPAHYILNPIKFKKGQAHVLNNYLMNDGTFQLLKKDSSAAVAKAGILNNTILKPDSSLSEFYCSYKNFKATGFRRDYGHGAKKYKNPCK